ncbi:hypothetical protein [Pseudoduganella sp.]|uniref:hypothetical protein n=1 Tax=Pseudoduganella sp. TaxID=1880898 RepID=UPI0035AEC7CE
MKRRTSRGAAMIELAAVLVACSMMLMACLNYGRLAMEGAVLDRAAADAARYLAALPPEELRDSARRGVVLANAQAMLEQVLQDSGLQVLDLQTSYLCGADTCAMVTSSNPLASMTVIAVLQYRDDWFGSGTLELRAQAEASRGK